MPLYRSRDDKIFGGVCGGLAQWLGWNPLYVRILYLVLGIMPFFAGIPIYLILWIVMPKEPREAAAARHPRAA